MGYDLHITRRKSSDDPTTITADVWLAYVRSDPELQLQPDNGPHFAIWTPQPDAWLDWHDGEIFSKNPNQPLINKMIAIANALHATLIGDDGEPYPASTNTAATQQMPPKPSLLLRLASLFSPRSKQPPPTKSHHLPTPFAVGDTVLDTFKNELTVISIDPTAEHGLGLITTRSRNGALVGHAMIAHDLKPKPTQKPPPNY